MLGQPYQVLLKWKEGEAQGLIIPKPQTPPPSPPEVLWCVHKSWGVCLAEALPECPITHHILGFSVVILVVLGTELSLDMLGKHSITELHLKPCIRRAYSLSLGLCTGFPHSLWGWI